MHHQGSHPELYRGSYSSQRSAKGMSSEHPCVAIGMCGGTVLHGASRRPWEYWVQRRVHSGWVHPGFTACPPTLIDEICNAWSVRDSLIGWSGHRTRTRQASIATSTTLLSLRLRRVCSESTEAENRLLQVAGIPGHKAGGAQYRKPFRHGQLGTATHGLPFVVARPPLPRCTVTQAQ